MPDPTNETAEPTEEPTEALVAGPATDGEPATADLTTAQATPPPANQQAAAPPAFEVHIGEAGSTAGATPARAVDGYSDRGIVVSHSEALPPPAGFAVQLGDDTGYTPSTIHGTLTGDRAIKLNRLVNGFAQQGINVSHFEALARLLDLI